jgi:hypothetical protein
MILESHTAHAITRHTPTQRAGEADRQPARSDRRDHEQQRTQTATIATLGRNRKAAHARAEVAQTRDALYKENLMNAAPRQ